MELDVCDRITADPTPEDIARAIDQRGDDPDWFMNLSDDDGYVEAERDERGRFRLAYHSGKARFDAAETVDAAALKTIFLAYLDGNDSWRANRNWLRKASPAKAAAASGEPPVWAIVAVVASLALIFVIAEVLPESWVERLPFAGTTFGGILLIGLPMVVMVAAMIINAVLKVRRAKGWVQAKGRITLSKMAARRPPAGNEIGTVVNVPDVAYAFKVGGQDYRGTRVSLGDISGKYAEEALARYPVGKMVTVFYDPADPEDCVLERDAPKGAVKGCGLLLVVLALLAGGFYWAVTQGAEGLKASMPDADVPVMLFAALFGLAALLFFVGHRRYLARANAWPVTQGEIVSSAVEQRRSTENGRTSKTYLPVIEFAYTVAGNRLHSRQVKLGLEVSGSESFAQTLVDRYPAGAPVDVHYDPQDPSNAALESPTETNWILLGVALACFAIALYASRVFR
ncbi:MULTISPECIES: DUF3592 domain-containing protein [unclassified Bosea (in: a-proteobacteria)]|uniref:DUF3592 domain-containing protein n=1 Tax=unclassified Bosea (in: a-proteobacteria) TaxID=2653178 RepID=UPI000F7533F4|nr:MULTISPECIES: DUF3592 domain-containing protein [unclassified Bosea (in: a-proteobacteria)]AZO76491.1 hypothetical protein BLM15_01890 [Bosea sp. Tri-49]RXT26417.1 hypothetical protein B5U98_07805 [Bosea sp. Tri-39]RXT31658.1 hypothetical protein B5U99_23350 [Bosea sp. Tri-54]